MAKQVTIIGAGPAGLLLAHYLLIRGKDRYQINIYDRRNDPRKVAFSKHRTYPMSLFERGLSALRNIPGLEEAVKAKGLQVIGSFVYPKNGKANLVARNNPITVIDRTVLTIAILDELEKKYDENRVNIHFNCKCIEVNFANKTAILEKEELEKIKIDYDLLIGADGARSIVRKHFANTDNFQCEEKFLPNEYKMLFTPRINEKLGIELQEDRFHIRRISDDFSIMAVPQPGNMLSCAVAFKKENNPFVNLSSQEKVMELFENHFPALAKFITPEAAEEFFQNPISNITTVSCNRYHQGDNAIIIGDAAHAVSPALGQGCNSALEDVVFLDKLLDEYKDDWAKVLPEFTSRRLPDLHALKDLSENGFPQSKILFFEFILRQRATKIIKKIFPQYESKFMFDTLETTMPYSEILKLSQNWVNKVKKSNQKLLEKSKLALDKQ
ncbi:MAG: NAD(P)/FAD-dependent oxidoreductase [Prochloraceae cyanobacterium]|nr:NAD(P)/FAD-dependent oxidoreductase [Prochloraceae cyanobacterium]